MPHIEHTPTGSTTSAPPRRAWHGRHLRHAWRGRLGLAAAVAAVAGTMTVGAVPASAATASNGPGANATWGEPHIQGFGDAIGSTSKLWYEVGDGQLGNVYYPQLDNPDTFGLQYYVSDGSTFTDNEVANTAHAIALADATSLEWQQTNTATSGKYTITKTYVADPARSVLLIKTTFTNQSSGPLALYAQYSPALNNNGMGNSGGTDSAGNDLTATNGTVSSALAASTGFTATSTGFAGTSSDGASILVSAHSLSTTYTGVASAGHITQTAQIPVAASGSTTFTLALAFGSSASAAVSDASASLGAGFTAAETSFRSGSVSFTWNVTSSGGGGGGKTEKVTVTVPVNTDASGQTVYLAGNLSVLGNGQSDWVSNGVAMTRVDATHWTATISATASTTLAYKYDLGGTWSNVEETAACGFVANRSMAVNGGTVADAVGDWTGPNTCGSAAAVVTVTVPSGTPSGATVYISGSYSALGTGMTSGNDWNAALYPMTKVDATHWRITVTAVPGSTLQYKYTLGAWTSVEETGSCGFVSNRSFVFGAAGSGPSANDTVAAWQGTSPC